MLFKVGCRLGYEASAPGTMVLNVRPALTGQQRVHEERLVITPELALQGHTMPESGNRYDRLAVPEGPVTIAYDALVELDVAALDPATVTELAAGELPFEVLPHLYPSRYCESDRLMNLAAKEFGQSHPGHLRVTEICNWIHDRIDYVRGSSDQHTSAMVTLVDRAGVCRDFAHLGVSLCRALGIPARFASCYALGLQPPDFHAVFEAYLGSRWYLFDPTRQAALDGLVRIGVGRDAAEVAFATLNGPVTPTEMKVWIEPADGADPDRRTVDAVSTSRL